MSRIRHNVDETDKEAKEIIERSNKNEINSKFWAIL